MTSTKDYASITDVDQLARLAKKMVADDKPVGFDLETGYYGDDFAKRATDHYNENQFVVGFSFSNDPRWARYVPIAHDEGGNIDGGAAAAWDAVAEMLDVCHVVSHNAKFERAAYRKSTGCVLAEHGKITDTMLLAFVAAKAYRGNWRTIVDLKGLVQEVFNHQMMQIHQLWPDLPQNKKAFIRFNSLKVTPEVVAYACEDAAWVLPLLDFFGPICERERPFITHLEHKIMVILEEMELQGVSADWDGITNAFAAAETFTPHMEEFVKQELGKLADRDISAVNLGSPKQLQELLFRDIGFKTTRLTPKKADNPTLEQWQKMSTDKKSLVALAKEHDAVRLLLEYREVMNLHKRLKAWHFDYSQSFDGKTHPSYKQAGAEDNENTAPGSGRFSAADPAIQQLPKAPWFWAAHILDFDPDSKKDALKLKEFKDTHRNGEDYFSGKFRNFVIASPDTYLLTYDYSQVELRMLAGASQEPALLRGFANDDDMHTLTAAMMLGKDPKEIDPDTERSIGKTFNFALMYGMGIKALGEQLGKNYDEAKDLYEKYFAVFSNVGNWMAYAKSIGLKRGYAETIFGRKVPVWELLSPQKGTQAKGSRILVNGPIQGSAADYMKIAMVRAHTELTKRNLWRNGCTITINMHDALTFEVSNSLDPNEIREILQSRVVFGAEAFPVLENYPRIRADWEIGQRWGNSTSWTLDQKAVFENDHWIVEREKSLDKLIVRLPSNPSEPQYREFIAALKKTDGPTHVSLELPEGAVNFPFTSDVTATSAKDLKSIFEGAIIECR